MKSKMIIVVLLVCFMSGCASVPKQPELKEGIVVEKNLTDAKASALDALVVNGFEVQKDTETYVQGKRPNKIGLFVGSGGETVGIWLEVMDDNKTRVLIQNKKSLVGYIGQQNWEREIRKEMLGVNK